MLDRRRFLASSAAIAGLAATSMPLRAAGSTLAITEAVRLPLYVSLHAADFLGLFAKHGVEGELSTAGTIALPVPMLLSGRADIGVTSPAMAVNAVREGGALKVIGKVVGGVALWAVARPDSGITSLADLKGKTIATLKFPSSTLQVPTYALRAAGLDPKTDVKFLELPLGAQIAAVKDGRADVATVFEWDVSIGVRDFGLKPVLSFAESVGPLVFTAAMATEKTIAEKPEAVQGFCDALAEAQAMLREDVTIIDRLAGKYYSQADAEIVSMAARNLMSAGNSVPRSPVVTPEEWDADMKLELAGGSIKEALPYDRMVDNSFAEKAAAKFA